MTNETAIALQETDAIAVNNVNGYFDGIIAQVATAGAYTTFKVETLEDKKRLYKATNDCKLLREYEETPLQICDFVFAPSDITDENGMPKTVLGVYLIDVEGAAYLSTAQGVIKSAVKILRDFGEPSTWGQPLPVVLKETNTAKGRRYKFLTVE